MTVGRTVARGTPVPLYLRPMRETVLEERDGAVLILTLNRPDQRNAFNRQMWQETRDALRDAQDDPGVHVAVVTGAGSAFSAGQDLGEMTGGAGGEDPGFGPFMDRLCVFDKPLLAAVNGVGVGIGLTLLLHCDVVYIAQGARLRRRSSRSASCPRRRAATCCRSPSAGSWQPRCSSPLTGSPRPAPSSWGSRAGSSPPTT